MKLKKVIAIILALTILILQLNFIQFNFVYAESTTANQISTNFHYNQLTQEGKSIYNAMYDMYEKGILKTGTQDYDLAEGDKYLTQEQLESYNNGNTTLKDAMNAARYAFYADYPEIFYVNFQKLTLRVTKGEDNRYHAYVGSGRYANYYIEGFETQEAVENAIVEFNNRVNEIVAGAEEIEKETETKKVVEQIKYVHNEIINNTGYRLESDCKEGNAGFLGTPYGALIKKESVCEGYARSLKTILDRLGINSILVQGTHQSEGSAAMPHMWNYVEIEEETKTREVQKVWYAVDATMDDPFTRMHISDETAEEMEPGDDIVEGFENTRYCLVGTETMTREHVAIEEVEAAGNYTFKYPEISVNDYGENYIVENNGLVVKFKQDGTETEDYKAGDFYISYNGKGYEEAVKEGKYIIARTYYYLPGDKRWDVSEWAYFVSGVYAGGYKDSEDHIFWSVPNSEYVEFAVTTRPSIPLPTDENGNPTGTIEDIKNFLTYRGDESDFVARLEKIHNINGTFKGRPYIKQQTPPATATISVGPTYHVDVTYTDELVLAEGATEVGYRMESTGSTGAEKSEITNFTFDGKNRVTFDLKFSEMYADDGAVYRIYLTGAVGKNSGKEPLEIIFGAANDIACAFSMNKAKSWNVFARPTLIENEDLSMKDWETSDGSKVSDLLKSRIALVTTKTTKTQNDTMNNLIEGELQDKELITSETYNISLNVCKKYVVKTGHKLRLSLGFPAGYGPEDAGVTFKAYHFITNNAGEVTGVEEIPCVVTPYGLIVTCDSFSPFAIAVAEDDGTQTKKEKAIIISDSEGGKINGANREEGNIVILSEENSSTTLNVKPDEGYKIEKITVCGEDIEVNNKDNMDITVNYSDVKDGNCIVSASFVSEEVVKKDEQRKENVVLPTAQEANVTIPQTAYATINKTLKIVPTVGEVEGILTYQWYKNGQKLEGKTNKILTIENVTHEDAGEYTLKVTTTVGTSSVEKESTPCNVIVRSFETSIVPKDTNIDLQKLNPGEEFSVSVNIGNLRNIEKGLVFVTGQFEYDSEILERISLEAQEGWSIDEDSFNELNLKFIAGSEKITKDVQAIAKIKFKVKDTITEEKQTTIKVKEITASSGDGIIASNDAQLELKVEIPEVVEKITSEKYLIEENYISKIPPKTTVSQFRANVETEQTIVFKDKNGNVIGEGDLIQTGATIDVGSTLHYTLVVIGDTDGDSEITINDLARLKLHVIKKELLTGIALKAADLDSDGEITINDVAQAKLVIIKLLEIK